MSYASPLLNTSVVASCIAIDFILAGEQRSLELLGIQEHV